ncbi:MAG: UbiX family flavin prenyltransferase [Candidatus Krumholzibacteriota bacterium]|nr:UbiX family flavin prenyltransferase [Candidatus Krumholzibacteriota bacterium]
MAKQASTRIVVALTGASGMPYAMRLLDALAADGTGVELVASRNADNLCRAELGRSLDDLLADIYGEPLPAGAGLERAGGGAGRPARAARDGGPLARRWAPNDYRCPAASGSGPAWPMAVLPCSMGTLGRIAAGVSDCLVTRAADVCLKERRPLVLVPRETPLSAIHLENMLRLARAGAVLLPASPGFYPAGTAAAGGGEGEAPGGDGNAGGGEASPVAVADLVDFVVDRVLVHLGLDLRLRGAWDVDA